MTMVRVQPVRVGVDRVLVAMRMRVLAVRLAVVGVLVMHVMRMRVRMTVLDGLVLVRVLVLLGHVEP
jgi:hypothetical protein